jgi:hypothetical protein
MQDLEQAIRERAYHLWVADGFRDGNADAHWLTAQREVLALSLGSFARVTVSDAALASAKAEKKSVHKGNAAAVRKKKRRAA